MMEYVLIICACATAFLFSCILFNALMKNRLTMKRRFMQLSKGDANTARRTSARRRSLFKRLTKGRSSRILVNLGDELYLASIALRPEEFLLLWFLSGIALPLVLLILEANLMAVIAFVILGSSLPVILVKMTKAKKMKRFDRQLVDALTVMCNSLRAGFSFQMAMDNIASEMPDPIAREFGRVAQECHLGMPLEESLERMVARTNNQDLELIVSAVLIQRQIGGNLAEVLDNISNTIRQRVKLRGDIKVLTSSGTMSGYIIGAMPIFMLVMLMVVNPSQVEVFFTTEIGRILLIVAVVMEVIGFTLVRKIVNIKL